MNRRFEVGFSQRIQLEWLELTANLFLAGYTRREIQAALDDFLLDKLSVGSESKSKGFDEKMVVLHGM